MNMTTRAFKVRIVLIVIAFIIVFLLLRNWKGMQWNFNNSTRESSGQTVDGKKQGEWKTYYLNGQLKEVKHYLNDTLNGQSIEYYPNGNLSSRATYKMGTSIDSFFLYHSNGQKNLQEWKDSNGHEQGVFNVYAENGQLIQIGISKDGQFDDTSRTYYLNGHPKEIRIYKNNMKEGVWSYFDTSGKLIRNETYLDDSVIKKEDTKR